MPPLKAFSRTDFPKKPSTPVRSSNDGIRSSAPHGRSSLSTNVVTVDGTGSPIITSSSMRHFPQVLESASSAESTPIKENGTHPRGMSTSKSIPNLRYTATMPSAMSVSSSTSSGIQTPAHQMRTRSRHSLAGTPLVEDGRNTPFYSPSTPSQFSRSTILPFDRQSSRHDAEEALRDSVKKPIMRSDSTDSTPAPTGWRRNLFGFGRKDSDDVFVTKSTLKRKGIVRKAKLTDR
jgi:hypothetical protein